MNTALDLASRVRTASSKYLEIHDRVFHSGVARSASFAGLDYARYIGVLSEMRTNLAEATRAAEGLSNDASGSTEVAYVSALRAYAIAVDEAVAKLLTLCRICAERVPRPPEVARYRLAVERFVRQRSALEEVESRLLHQRGQRAPSNPPGSSRPPERSRS